MRVLVTTPYGVDSLQGNTVSAKRIASLLEEAGLESVVVSDGDDFSNTDVLIALHARKSAHFIDDYLSKNPRGKVLLYLTGTDLYADIPNGCAICQRTMQLADKLVVSQEASLNSVPDQFHSKTEVIYTSIELPEVVSTEVDEVPLISCVGHLRAVKKPLMGVKAMQLIEGDLQLKLLGNVVDEDLGAEAHMWQKKDERFQWLGCVSHEKTMEWVSRSVATLNTSVMEGGANSVGESIVLGVPVLASNIEGNVGMLGEDYDGYFSAESEAELAELMQRVIYDEVFLEHLREQVRKRSVKFTRENEKRGWLDLIKGVE